MGSWHPREERRESARALGWVREREKRKEERDERERERERRERKREKRTKKQKISTSSFPF